MARAGWTQKRMCEVADDERSELGLGAHDPFDPYALAGLHGIRIYALSELTEWGLGSHVHEHFSGDNSSKWSAALLPIGDSRVILDNDTHAEVRRRASIAHELGHHLLEHPFGEMLVGDRHERVFDQKTEDQANFMARELLIPREAARAVAFRDWTDLQVALHFGVSEQFARMQMHLSGARKIAKRARIKRGGKQSLR